MDPAAPYELPTIVGGWERRAFDLEPPVELWVPKNPDALLDDEAVQERHRFNDSMPYWAWIWDSAPTFARALQRHDFDAAARVLELGAGLGLNGIAFASRTRASVTLTDHDPLALDALRVNVELNGVDAHVADLDWRRPDAIEAGAFDVVLGCDVSYEGQAHEPLLEVLDHALASGGVAHLADPGRARLPQFLKRAAGRAFEACTFDADGEPADPETGRFRRIELRRR